MYCHIWRNVKCLSAVPSETEDNYLTQGNAVGDSLTWGPIDIVVKEFSKLVKP